MKKIGLRIEGEVDKRPRPVKISERVGKQVARDKYMIEFRKRLVELTGDNETAELDRRRLDRKMVTNLIGDGGEEFRRYRLPDCTFFVKKSNLAQQRVSGWRLRRPVYDPYLMAEVTRHPGEHSRVGGNTSSLLEREIESVEDNPLWHWDRGPKMSPSYGTGSSDVQAR